MEGRCGVGEMKLSICRDHEGAPRARLFPTSVPQGQRAALERESSHCCCLANPEQVSPQYILG